MSLKELLNITCTNSVIKLYGINKERCKSELATIKTQNEYKRTDLTIWNKIIEQYGANRIIHQYLENNNLCILITIG